MRKQLHSVNYKPTDTGSKAREHRLRVNAEVLVDTPMNLPRASNACKIWPFNNYAPPRTVCLSSTLLGQWEEAMMILDPLAKLLKHKDVEKRKAAAQKLKNLVNQHYYTSDKGFAAGAMAILFEDSSQESKKALEGLGISETHMAEWQQLQKSIFWTKSIATSIFSIPSVLAMIVILPECIVDIMNTPNTLHLFLTSLIPVIAVGVPVSF